MNQTRNNIEQTFCPVPWVSSSVTNQGVYRACCQCSQSSCGGILKDQDGIPLNASKASFEQIRNHSTLKSMRKDMLNGVRSSLCKACWDEEDAGIVSKRQSEIKKLNKFFNLKDAQRCTSDEGEISPSTKMVSLDLRFGNNCNLACIMCGPLDSKAWYADYVKATGKTRFGTIIGDVELEKAGSDSWITKNKNKFEWYDEEHFWSELKKYADGLKYIYMAGGEPLITPKHHELLKNLIELNVAKNIELDYATNFTVLPPEVLEYWTHFKGVNLGISIDGTGKINDYIRFPSQWEKIERNFDQLENLTSVNLHVYTNSTISALNMPSSLTTLKWFIERRKEKKYPQQMFVHPVYGVNYLSPKVLPKKIKEKVKTELLHLKENSKMGIFYNKSISQSIEQFQNIVNFSLEEDLSHLREKLIAETEKLDLVRGHRWNDFLEFNLTDS